MIRQHIVFLTGAGISVESGLSTFRGKDGLWTNDEWAYMASTEALYTDTQRCLDFYNFRRKQLAEVEPNDAHRMIAELEKEHDVTVITQNVDNLHERAGSTHVIHLHGELSKVCSTDNRETCVKEYPLATPIMVGDKADDGSQLRPYVALVVTLAFAQLVSAPATVPLKPPCAVLALERAVYLVCTVTLFAETFLPDAVWIPAL